MSERVYNFCSGPSLLPEAVLRRAQDALWDLGGSGVGVLEVSHRGGVFAGILEAAEARLRRLLGVPDDYAVLFLQGGGSSQFFMVPMNLLGRGATADYLCTGEWSKRAIVEARRFGEVHVAASSEAGGHVAIPRPEEIRWSANPAYAYFTSNNTIYGTQWLREPDPPAGVPLLCDASSDLLSRPIDVAKYGLIFAGAQKNLGIAGITVVIIRRDLVERSARDLPTMLQYRTHADHHSLYNTPPTFAIYVLGEMLTWLEAEGGVAAIAQRNQHKAALIYDHLDRSPLFRPLVEPGSRSLMNVRFASPSAELDTAFHTSASARGLVGLKGHRAIGGLRASIYNAFPVAGCQALVDFMREFEAAHG